MKSKQTQTIQARGRLCTYLTPSRSEGEVEGEILGFGTVSGSNVSGCSWAVRLERSNCTLVPFLPPSKVHVTLLCIFLGRQTLDNQYMYLIIIILMCVGE